VPVYISYEAHEHGDAAKTDKKEWQRIYHEANAKLKRSGTVHVYILAPADGEVIESIDVGTAVFPEKLLARLSAVIDKLKTPKGKPVVAPVPQSCPPKCDAGALVLHLAARSYKGTWNEFPVENWTALSAGEAGKLLPTGNIAAGGTWELDKAVTAKFLKHCLPNGFDYAGYHKVTIIEQSLQATVLSLKNGVARARLDGKLKLKHKTLNFQKNPPVEAHEFAQMPLTGYLDFEPGKQKVQAFRLLADPATAREGAVVYAVAVRSIAPVPAQEPGGLPKEVRLFDFEESADPKAWSNLELPGAKVKEPPAKMELSDDNTTLGKKSLKTKERWPQINATSHWPC
jgi:hypothetical protein